MCCTCWPEAATISARCRQIDRTAQTESAGRKAGRSSPTEWRYCNHWQSCQSVLRPGTFFRCRALTRHGRKPACLFEHLVERDPIDSRGLQRHRSHPTTLQPPDQRFQVAGERVEHSDRLSVPVWTHRHEHLTGSDIDSRGIRLQNGPLLAAHSLVDLPAIPQRFHRILLFIQRLQQGQGVRWDVLY